MLRLAKPILLGAALMAGVAAPASAADLYEPPVIELPPPVRSYGGWYIRGHIGMSNQRVDSISHPDITAAIAHEWLQRGSFSSAPTFGIGAGYQVNKYLRGDITVEYRGGADFRALDRLFNPDLGQLTTNDYRARKTEWLMLANAYVDVGHFWKIKPYVGAGIGVSRNTISDFRDFNVQTGGGGYAATASQWNLAWALHAGLGFDVTDNLTLDLGYSFVNLGNARTGTVLNDDPAEPSGCQGGGTCAPVTFNRLVSHDLKLGLRYKFGEATKVHHDYEPYQPVPAYEPTPVNYTFK
jgi:opacity protein-like surface antigen